MRRRWLRSPALLGVLVGLTGACAGPGSGDLGRDEPRAGGDLRVGVVGLTTLDPAQADTPSEVVVAAALFESLTGSDPETSEPVPGLAQRWEAAEDQRSFTFVLREDATFSDGRPVTAADVRATLDRVRDPVTASPLASLLEGVERVDTPDETTVVIELRAPDATLPARLAHPGLGVAAADALSTVGEAPVGAGPFRLDSRSGTTTRLVRARPAADDGPWLDALEVVDFLTEADAVTAFIDGSVDVASMGRELPAESPTDRSRVYRDAPYLAVGFYVIDVTSPKFSDPRLREAIVRAADARALVTAGYGASELVAEGLVPRGVPGGPSDACIGRCDHDPEAARALLGEAFPSGGVPTVIVDFDETPAQRASATALIGQLSAVGIPATGRPHPPEQYDDFLANGDPEVFRLGWVGDYASAAAFLTPLFVPGAPENLAGIDAPGFTDALAGALGTADEAAQADHLLAAERAVLDQFAVIPVVQFETRYAVINRLRGFTISPLGAFDTAAVWIDRG